MPGNQQFASRYSGSCLCPRWLSVWFWTLRRVSSKAVLASFTTWNGSATCAACGNATSNAARYGPDKSSVAQTIPASQSGGCANSQRVGALAVRPATMSRSCPRLTSTMLVDQALAPNRPRRHIRVSSSPKADTAEIRSVSTSSSAEPQRCTDVLTVCHPQPNTEAVSLIASPRPACRVAHRVARSRQQRPLWRDLRRLLSHRRPSTVVLGASPTALVPHQPHRTGQTPANPPTSLVARQATTTNPHNPHTTASVPGSAHAPPTAHPARLQRRAPPHLQVPPTTRTCV